MSTKTDTKKQLLRIVLDNSPGEAVELLLEREERLVAEGRKAELHTWRNHLLAFNNELADVETYYQDRLVVLDKETT